MNHSTKHVGILLPIAGIMSEIWVKRQAESFRYLEPRLITWEKHQPSAWNLNKSDALLNIQWNPKRTFTTKLLNKIGYNPELNEALTSKSLASLFGNDMPAAVICHFGWTAAKTYKFFKSKHVPYFIVFHGSDLALPALNGGYGKKLKEAIKNATGCIIVGSHMKDILRDIEPDLNDNKVHQIPCGAPMEEFCKHPQTTRLDNEPLNLITVGRLVHGKGIDLCLEALQLLRAKNIEVQLSIIGDGEEKASLIDMTKSLKLEDSVTFLGHQPPEEIAYQLSKHHVFLQPSRKAKHGWIEGFGVSITEAMASALPVIASQTGGIPDQVRNNKDGFLIDIDDYKSIAECILRYESNEDLRHAHGHSARKQAQRFDAKVLSQKLEDIILQKMT